MSLHDFNVPAVPVTSSVRRSLHVPEDPSPRCAAVPKRNSPFSGYLSSPSCDTLSTDVAPAGEVSSTFRSRNDWCAVSR